MSIIDVEGAAARMRRGDFVIIVDDAERENEGDLAIAADMVTPDKINFMALNARGLVCVPLLGERLDELGLPMMVRENTTPLSTAFTQSVDAKDGVTTGISTADRSNTIRALVHPETRSGDLTRPGHMFPLRYREGGVLVRTGHTEAVIDLARVAGLYPAGVICEIMNEDGTMARMPELEKLSEEWEIPIISIAQIIEYRRQRETMVERRGIADLPTRHGVFRAYGYASAIDAKEHVALVMGDIATDEPVLTRVHSECLTGDVFSSMRCDCGEQVDLAAGAHRGGGGRRLSVYEAGRTRRGGCTTSCARTRCRTRDSIRSRPTCKSAFHRTCGNTASARRSSLIWASAGSS